MRHGLMIKELAKERAMTLASIAKKLGIPRSNMSAIASGSRGASLKVLKKISLILGCSLDELILDDKIQHLFRDKKLESLVILIEKESYDGVDKTWVDRVMLAQNLHYKNAKRGKRK